MKQKTLPAECKIIILGAGITGLTAAVSLRRAGHEVHVYETTRVEDEGNEIVQICPNANSVLRQLGIALEAKVGCPLREAYYYSIAGSLLGSIDMKDESHLWQDPWLVSPRIELLGHLKDAACSETLPGQVVQVHKGLQAISVDIKDSTVRLNDDTLVNADLVIGADGLQSTVRGSIVETSGIGSSTQPPFSSSSGLKLEVIQRSSKSVADEPRTDVKVFAAENCGVVVATSEGKTSIRTVGYDTSNPRSQSNGEVSKILQDHGVIVRDATEKAEGRDIISSSLVDADIVPLWTRKRLIIIGEAAYYFPPQFIYRTALKIEDSASLGVLLSEMKTKEDVLERLEIFSEIRLKRITEIKELSGKAWSNLVNGKFSRDDIDYVFNHNGIHYATETLRQHMWAKSPSLSWRQPVGFGPMISPRQHTSGSICSNPREDRLAEAQSLIASIRFRTSKTLLRNIFPSDAYTFVSRGSTAEASFVFQSIRNLAWLGGGGYNLVLFQIHGIQHKSRHNNTTRQGSYVALVLEDLTDPIISGREDLGWPKLYSDISVQDNTHAAGGLSVNLAWRGTSWMSLFWGGLHTYRELRKPSDSLVEHVFVHKYIPATAKNPNRQTADADYDVLMPPPSVASKPVEWQRYSTNPGFVVEARSEQELPTLWHIADRLAELPNLGIVEARLGHKQGQDDFSGAARA